MINKNNTQNYVDSRAHERIDNLVEDINLLKEQHRLFSDELRDNTELTRMVEKNTADAVDLLKGGKVLGKALTFMAACTALYYFIFDHFSRR